MIRRIQTKCSVSLSVVVYRLGVQIFKRNGEIDILNPKDVELYWAMAGHFKISTSLFSPTMFAWENTKREVSFKYIAVKSSSPWVLRQKDTFMWMTNLPQECPNGYAYFTCKINLNRKGGYKREEAM